MLRLVTFDLDGTLYANSTYVPGLIWRWFTGNFASAPWTTLKRVRAARLYQKARESLRARGQVTDLKAEAFAEAARSSGYPEAFVRETIDALIYANPFEGSAAHVFPGTHETLVVLKSRGLKLAVLSDYPVDTKLQALGLADVGWDLLMSAEDVNALKPHPALFAEACARLAVDPADALHVGDRPDCDTAGARAAGMKTLLFRGEGRPPRPGPRADYEAASYAALRTIVETLAGVGG
ncbi:MAG: HAD family hydrolase [Candidatus Wallbacteria bacterium]|nr:HAD family hydrolase [Candidatus Wallbacteria bacterium]